MKKVKNLFKKCLSLFVTGALCSSMLCVNAKADVDSNSTENTNITYKAHVENIGWQNAVSNGETAGTIGQNLTMQAIQIDYPNNEGLKLEYQVHVQDKGWLDVAKSGEIAGTVGENRPMEAISIALKDASGKDSTNYSVYYRTHVSEKGWTTWSKNGSISGTVGENLAMQAIQVCVAKVGTSKYAEMESLISDTENLDISYKAHVENEGWQGAVSNGETAGTTGKLLKMQAIQIDYPNKAGLKLEYQVHVQDKGWLDVSKGGEVAGTVGENRPMEAISIALKDASGKDSTNYSVYYRTHLRDLGWTVWSKDGNISGTVGENIPMEAIQICVAKVGTSKYAEMESLVSDTENISLTYRAHVTNEGWQSEVTTGYTAGTTGKNLSMQAIQINYPNKAGLNIEYAVHVQDLGWLQTVRNGEVAGTVGRNLPIEGICIALKDANGKDSTNYSVFYRTYVREVGWTNWGKDGDIAGTVGKNLAVEGVQITVCKVGTQDYYNMKYKVDHPEPIKFPSATPKQIEKIINIAAGEVGYREGAGNFTKYGTWFGMQDEWCAIFVSWCANQAGISTDIIPKHSLCSSGANWFKNRGLWVAGGNTPNPGDIIYFYRRGDINHVGIVKSVSGGIVTTIEGNSSNMVAERTHKVSDSDIAGYGRPKYQ
ncbi:CHAP domain-containing protein [uncultured Clostridium sp.]|uniref:CHAP domain-containing protein n=1 Tax=uncultured Clostridium sp. TaxID=59620 RepID=UPI0025D35DED|nr:CHAP domain-containing protein [uncultured Clostridium sp.]